MGTELDLSGLSQSQLWTRLENDDPRFRDLRALGWQAANGSCANTTVTIEQGRQLLILLIEAQQYREAHAHSQELRSAAEQDAGRLRDALREVLDAYDRYVDDRNLYTLSCHCDAHSGPRKLVTPTAVP